MPLPLIGSLLMNAASSAGAIAGTAGAFGTVPGIAAKAVGAAGAAGGAISASQKGKAMKSLIDGPAKTTKNIAQMASKKAGMAGVSLSLGAILKQSQLFTGFIGSLFQILGAFIDVLLAPLMPFLFKGLAWVAKGIPVLQSLVQRVVDWVAGIWKASDGIGSFIANMLLSIIENVWKFVTNMENWKTIGGFVISALKAGLAFLWDISLGNLVLQLANGIWDMLPSSIKDPINDIADWVKGVWQGLSDWWSGIWGSVERVFWSLIKWVVDAIGKSRFFDTSDTSAALQAKIDSIDRRIQSTGTNGGGASEVSITVEGGIDQDPMNAFADDRAKKKKFKFSFGRVPGFLS